MLMSMDQRPNILHVEDAAEVKQMCGRPNMSRESVGRFVGRPAKSAPRLVD
jgi:hypothetical protein